MKVNDGSIELLKWIAIVSMTLDHINKYLFNGTLPYLYEIGRIALPIFIFVMAYNLNRPGVLENRCVARIAIRVFAFGLIATVPFVLLGGLNKWFLPLNVLFTLLSVIAVVVALNRGGYLGFAGGLFIFAVTGAVVEFGWSAIFIGVATWAGFKYRSYFYFIAAILGCISLEVINMNFFALAAMPIIAICLFISADLPRFKHFFYVYYPLHLLILLLVRIPMSKAGYFFIGA